MELKLRPSQKTSLAFGRSVSTRSRTLQFDVSAQDADKLNAYAQLAADFDPFLRSDDAELERRMMSVQAEFRDGRVRLTLCADRAGGEPLGDPGTYEGTVSIVDPRVSRIDIPFTITLAEPRWPIVVDIGVLTVIAAMWWAWLLVVRSADTWPKLLDWPAWLFEPEGILTCGLGVVGAAGAFATVYLKSATWSLDALQVAGLAAAVFSAFIAASTATRVAQYVTTNK
ncbi:hypothetical protein [Virgisporangium aurantiacum]|uniref:Uncharacterized protein n=1 Tax=Virgisporangium aurantiacum TaxID=175570 RepID=A0A8J4E7P6_9ACTN|nr:hypothetical protein [Virgisporangium aurantiacum]GIJ62007.1 hypothetical protein Vau01_095230 [Virgisporangium aurantiacum]